MKRLLRLLLRVAGLGLIVLVLWLVGWSDRVTDTEGVEHRGRIVSTTTTEVVLRTDEGEKRIPIEDPRAVQAGLASAFSTFAGRPHYALIAACFHLLAMCTTFFRWGLLLGGAGLHTPMRQVFRYGWIGQFIGTVLPGGTGTGDVVRAFYVAREHGGRKMRAIVTVFVDRVLGLMVLSLIACVAVLFAPEGSALDRARGIVVGIFVAGLVAAALLFSARVRQTLMIARLLRRLPFQRVLWEAQRSVEIYGERPRLILVALLLSLVGHALFLTAFVFYAAALGRWLPILAIGVAIPVSLILSSIPALPGGWGVGDLAFYTFLPTAGVAAGTAVALSFIWRLMHTLLSLPGGLWFSRGKEHVDREQVAKEMAAAT